LMGTRLNAIRLLIWFGKGLQEKVDHVISKADE